MKHNKNQDYALSDALKLEPVLFEFTHSTAQSVAIAGTFNDWHPTTKSMWNSGNGHWLKEAFLRPGSYEYCLVVDDEWMADPLAKDHVPNSFGGTNSILTVANLPEAAHLDDAENLQMRDTKI